VIKASLDAGSYTIAGVALVVSALTIFSMTKIWALGFWKPHPEGDEAIVEKAPVRLMVAPIAVLAVLTVLIGLLPEPVYQLADRAAGELLDRSAYISAVLGGQP
jgi:multicomponent Na+:H+ antiporter subunit D